MEIIKGSARKPVSTERLIELVEKSFKNEDGVLYVGYPVLSSSDESVSIDALLISKRHGVVAINLIEGREAGEFGEVQDDLASLLEAKFRPQKSLRAGRQLLAVPNTITYAPLLQSSEDADGHQIVNDEEFVEAINSFSWRNPDLYEPVLSVIQSISTIRRNRKRRINERKRFAWGGPSGIRRFHSQSRRTSKSCRYRNRRGRSTHQRAGRIGKNNCSSLKGGILAFSKSKLEDCSNLQYTISQRAICQAH